jgi:transposase
MWTTQNRKRYDRSQLRYPSDLTGDEWARVEPLIPPARRGGNKRHVDVREVMNGIMYILSTGCQWRAVPKGFVVLPKRWIVERTIAWLNRCRRLAKDWENLNHKALAFLRLASIRIMLRKLCNPA